MREVSKIERQLLLESWLQLPLRSREKLLSANRRLGFGANRLRKTHRIKLSPSIDSNHLYPTSPINSTIVSRNRSLKNLESLKTRWPQLPQPRSPLALESWLRQQPLSLEQPRSASQKYLFKDLFKGAAHQRTSSLIVA